MIGLGVRGAELPEAAALIQRFQAEQYFSQTQAQRMQDLLARRASLTADVHAELESLVDAELDATVARLQAMSPPVQP